MEKGLLRNVKDLTIRPVSTIKSYISGKTKDYLNPVAYFLIVLTLITLFNTFSENLTNKEFEASLLWNEDDSIQQQNTFMMLFFGFGLSIGMTFFSRYNLLQSSIISLFVTSQLFLLITLSELSPIIYLNYTLAGIVLLYFIATLYNLLSFGIINKIWRLILISFITLLFLGLGTLALSRVRPLIEVEKISDFKIIYEQQVRDISKLQNSVLHAHSKLSSTIHDSLFHVSRKYKEELEAKKELLIQVTGGVGEDSVFIGSRDKEKLKIIVPDILTDINEIQTNWERSLSACNCKSTIKHNPVQPSNLSGVSMIQALIEFNSVQKNILIIELQCYSDYLSLSKK